jgi:hypothetical protein
VRPIAKPILTVAAILIAGMLSVCLILNAYLTLPATRNQIESGIGYSLGMPVTIGSIFALPWPVGTVRIGNIKGGREADPQGFSAPSIILRPDFTELLHGRIVASGVELKRPVLRLSTRQPIAAMATPSAATPGNFGGSFTATSTPRDIKPPTPGIASPATETVPARNALSGASTPAGEIPPSLPLKSIRVEGGDFSYIDDKGNPILTLKGFTMRGALNGENWKGNLNAPSIVIGSSLIFRNLHAGLTGPANLSSLDLSPCTASFGGGTLSGTASLTSLRQSPSFSLTLHLSDGRLEKLLSDASLGTSSAQGKITGDLRLEGMAGKGSTMNGAGNLLCKEVTVEPVSFLKQIGQFLNIEELKLLRLSEGKCLFRVDQGRFVVDDLFLRSENLILAAKGPLDSTGQLNLESRLLFNENLTRRLGGLLGNKLTPAPEQGYTQIAFRVSGPAMNPRTDLLERLTGIRIGGDLGGFGGLIQGLFGAPKPQTPATPPPLPPAQTPRPTP